MQQKPKHILYKYDYPDLTKKTLIRGASSSFQYTADSKNKIIRNIITQVPKLVDLGTGEHLITTTGFPPDSTESAPAHLREAWSEQAFLIYAIASSEIEWEGTTEQYYFLDKAYEELEIKRKALIELNRMKYRTILNSPMNEYVAAQFKKNFYRTESIVKELEEGYNDLSTLFNLTGIENPYDWSPVKPQRLTVTNFKQLPKNSM